MKLPMDKKQVPIQKMACYRTGHKPLSELRIVKFTGSDIDMRH